MKVLTGALRGQRIAHKISPGLRPTSDKTRKAIFDILQGRVEGKAVLDLFSGTGALGIEALSGGAARAVFVEMDRLRAMKIEENLKRLGLAGKSAVMTADAQEAVKMLAKRAEIFDLVFLDPPYSKNLALTTLGVIEKLKIVNPDALIVAECHTKEKLPEAVGRLKSIKTKVYGDTQVSLYQAKQSYST